MLPQISIVVPVYEVEPYIDRCVKSILAQTFSDFELILVDDGSPDNCGKICDEYAIMDSRVKVIHKENGGLSSARNIGIKAAKGNYIIFVDSDDYIHEQMFEVLYNSSIEHSSDLVVCDFLKVTEAGFNQKELTKYFKTRHFTNIEALHQLFLSEQNDLVTGAGNNIKWIVVWNKLFRRSLFDNLKFDEGRICEDEFIAHKILYHSAKITYVECELYYYFQRSNSIINSPFTMKRLDKVYALKERADFFRKIKQYELEHKAIKSYINAFFWNYDMAKSVLDNSNNAEFKKLKKTLDKSIIFILKNPLINWKQKVVLLLFYIHPYTMDLFKTITKVKNVN